MAVNASEGFNQALELFSSLYEDMSPTDLCAGLSPDNQDVWYLPGSVQTRPAFQKTLSSPVEPTSDTVSITEYPAPSGDFFTIWLSSLGNLWQQDSSGSSPSQLNSVTPGSQFRSVAAFEKQWFAFFNSALSAAFTDSPFVGAEVPRYYDGNGVWRVTQDAPGANPVFTNVVTQGVAITQSTPTGTATVTGVVSSGRQIVTEPGIPGIGRLPGTSSTTYIIYTTLVYTCSAPVSASWVNTPITVTGLTGTNASLANVTGRIIAVSGSTFTINVGTGETLVNLSAQSGTATLSGNYFSRTANVVTVYVGTSLPQNFTPGFYIKVAAANGAQINGTTWTIDGTAGISRDVTGLVTIIIDTQLTNLAAGTQLYIAATDTTNFPVGLQTVYQVVSSSGGKTVFTISNPTWGPGTVVSSSTGGSVYQIWSGVFQIQTAAVDSNGNAYLQYFQLGPDATLAVASSPTVQLQSQIPPGPRNAVLIFEGQNGAQTAPSIPIQLSIVGGTTLLSAQQIPIGPPGTTRRIIAFTPAYGSSYYYLSPAIVPSTSGLPPILSLGTIVADNTTTSVILDFSDAQLLTGVQIDIQGNNLFNQIVLAPCLGCIEYEGRMAWWGEINNIKNLINVGFDGGYTTTSAAGIATAGATSGSGVAWSNPSNIASASSYADVALALTPPTSGQSQNLSGTGFGFTFSVPVGAVTGVISVTVQAYLTGSLTYDVITATLLKAGVPFGSPVSVTVTGGTGSAAAPVVLTFSFPAGGLTAGDINNSLWGVQFSASFHSGNHLLGTSNDLFLRGLSAGVTVVNDLPLGWDVSASTGGTGLLIPNGTLGFSYQMAGAGGPFDALISQPCFKDYYGSPIFLPSTPYLLRLLIQGVGTLNGNFVCDIVSPTQGTIATATIPVANLTANLLWEVLDFSAAMPAAIPADAVVRIYLQNSNATVTIDELEFIDADVPVLFQQMRMSYFGNEFGYDQTTGLLAIDSSAKITAAFKQRGYLYALTDGPLHQTQNNGSTEPSGWSFPAFADECDCFGPNAVTVTEDIAWWAGQSGSRVFDGSKPKKLSQEIQVSWDSINSDASTAAWMLNDPEERIVYAWFPTGNSTVPNLGLPMSYRSVDAAYNVPDPLHTSYSGKMIATDLCRKWTRWNAPMTCGALLTRPGLGKQPFFGGQKHGNFYALNFAKFTDDDYGQIFSYYTTYFFFNHDIEQNAPGVGLHQKLYAYLTAYVTGVGTIQPTALLNNLANPWVTYATVWDDTDQIWTPSGAASNPFAAVPLVGGFLPYDIEWGLNIKNVERLAIKWQASPLPGTTDAAFFLNHMVVTVTEDKVTPVRGSNIVAVMGYGSGGYGEGGFGQ